MNLQHPAQVESGFDDLDRIIAQAHAERSEYIRKTVADNVAGLCNWFAGIGRQLPTDTDSEMNGNTASA
ncbi:MAG: hypothetical protein WED00_11350 [Aquisalimonadaceae bacterium]